MFRPLLRRAWLLIPLGLLIFAIPTWWMRVWLPQEGSLPTPTAVPTTPALDATYSRALQLAASDPLSALPLLDDVAFSANSHAEAAHTVWQAIESARLANDAGYTFTASGRALAAVGEWALARQALVKAVELDPDYAEAWAYLGEAQEQNGEDGLPALQRAMDLDSQSISVNLFMALYWQRKGKYEDASQNFARAAFLAPTDPMIEIQWGQNLVLAGKSPQGLEHFQRALELAPGDAQVLRALADYSIGAELYVAEIGLPAAQKLLLANAKDVSALLFNARGHALLNHIETARSFFERAVEVDPTNLDAHLYFGIFLIGDAKNEQATEELNEVIALAPASSQADLAAYWLAKMSH